MGNWFTRSTNKIGPTIDPWGTPTKIERGSERKQAIKQTRPASHCKALYEK